MIFLDCSTVAMDADNNLIALGVGTPSFELKPEDAYFEFDPFTTDLAFTRSPREGYVGHARWRFPWNAPMHMADLPIECTVVYADSRWVVYAPRAFFDGSGWVCSPDDDYNIFIFQKH
jgi:hypothetical protein